jgi:hypothetical protein
MAVLVREAWLKKNDIKVPEKAIPELDFLNKPVQSLSPEGNAALWAKPRIGIHQSGKSRKSERLVIAPVPERRNTGPGWKKPFAAAFRIRC